MEKNLNDDQESKDDELLFGIYDFPKDDEYLSFIDKETAQWINSVVDFKILAELNKRKYKGLFTADNSFLLFGFIQDTIIELPLHLNNPYQTFLACNPNLDFENEEDVKRQKLLLKCFIIWFKYQIKVIDSLDFKSDEEQAHYEALKEHFIQVKALLKAKSFNISSSTKSNNSRDIESPQQEYDIEKLQPIQNLLRLFDGQNPVNKEKICAGEDALGIKTILSEAILNEKFDNKTRFQKLNIANDTLLHTLYRIAKYKWGKSIPKSFTEMITKMFIQLERYEFETVYKKWSTMPKTYEMDFPFLFSSRKI